MDEEKLIKKIYAAVGAAFITLMLIAAVRGMQHGNDNADTGSDIRSDTVRNHFVYYVLGRGRNVSERIFAADSQT